MSKPLSWNQLADAYDKDNLTILPGRHLSHDYIMKWVKRRPNLFYLDDEGRVFKKDKTCLNHFIANTITNETRVYVSKAAQCNKELCNFMDLFSIWRGMDKMTENSISWEIPKLYIPAVNKVLRDKFKSTLIEDDDFKNFDF